MCPPVSYTHLDVYKRQVLNGGVISNHKGINVPGVKLNLPAVTERDVDDIEFGCKMGIDLIAASFVRKAADVLELRHVIEKAGSEDCLLYTSSRMRLYHGFYLHSMRCAMISHLPVKYGLSRGANHAIMVRMEVSGWKRSCGAWRR